ncbi:hypothetical protein [Gordonia sp. CPCC 205515]|uniref:hypothetical protein n=1 Tax=Gordonia sp. CPCC 205515 TaxID=3140791 RepID=UPI003AF387F2
MDNNDRYDTGMGIRRATMGDEYVDAALDRTAGTESARIQEAVTELVCGAACGADPDWTARPVACSPSRC